jgi:hypothetical protein
MSMGAVTIRCPRTGRAVSTEIETEAADFSRLPAVVARMRCPLCGDEHSWTASEAWLEAPGLAPQKLDEPEKN